MYKLCDELQESYLLFLFGSLVINARKLFKNVSLEKEKGKEERNKGKVKESFELIQDLRSQSAELSSQLLGPREVGGIRGQRDAKRRIVPGTDLSGKRDTRAKSFYGEFMADNGIKKQSIPHSFQVGWREGGSFRSLAG